VKLIGTERNVRDLNPDTAFSCPLAFTRLAPMPSCFTYITTKVQKVKVVSNPNFYSIQNTRHITQETHNYLTLLRYKK
jgi:hypothetical protein